MLEVLCSDALRDACHEAVSRERDKYIVRLKGQPHPARKYENFFAGADGALTFQFAVFPATLFSRKGKLRGSLERLAYVWGRENATAICEAYLRSAWNGDIETAMDAAANFDDLFNQFTVYFIRRRTDFMEKTETALAQIRSEVAARGRTAQSHGGVANLLKVLTRTMKEQGCSIYSIAKMQYGVCLQAGIYLPEEFLTDILVAGEMMEVAQDGTGQE